MLVNRVTKQMYVGKAINLKARYQEWRGVINAGFGVKSHLMGSALVASNSEDWTFNVVLLLPGATNKALLAYEERAIHKVALAHPDLLLNTLISNAKRHDRAGNEKSIIIDDNGVEVLRSVAAGVLGNTRKVIDKKLARRRRRGITVVRLSDLVVDKKQHYHQTKVA